jgi:hypothetical protein
VSRNAGKRRVQRRVGDRPRPREAERKTRSLGLNLFSCRTGGFRQDVMNLLTGKIGPVYGGKPPFWGRKFLLFHEAFSFEGLCGPDKPRRGNALAFAVYTPVKAEHASSSASQEWEVRSAAITATLRGQESLVGVPFEEP